MTKDILISKTPAVTNTVHRKNITHSVFQNSCIPGTCTLTITNKGYDKLLTSKK